MPIFKTKSSLAKALSAQRASNAKIGYVPTMGALHEGHLSLISRCLAENDVCVVSIFVNPTQFNNNNDLQKYPRTLQADMQLIETVGQVYVFAPSVEEMYDNTELQQTHSFDFKGLDQVMEGKFRPGHFNGVVQIVGKFFDIIHPDRAYFGEKDFQQLAIIRLMVKNQNRPIEIVACPIVRQSDGLAMSSRNALLSDKEKETATAIYAALKQSTHEIDCKSVKETIEWVTEKIEKQPDLRVEYFEIVNGNTLQSVSKWTDADYIVGCITVFCGEVRLIDNIQYIKTK